MFAGATLEYTWIILRVGDSLSVVIFYEWKKRSKRSVMEYQVDVPATIRAFVSYLQEKYKLPSSIKHVFRPACSTES